jgi:hypothetical protein
MSVNDISQMSCMLDKCYAVGIPLKEVGIENALIRSLTKHVVYVMLLIRCRWLIVHKFPRNSALLDPRCICKLPLGFEMSKQ